LPSIEDGGAKREPTAEPTVQPEVDEDVDAAADRRTIERAATPAARAYGFEQSAAQIDLGF